MNPIANIWLHPRTTAAGLLISVVSIAGVLSQQGVTLGHAGSGTVATLVGAVAAALLGLLARDPAGSSAASISAQKLGASALIALLLPLPLLTGCNATSVAQDIVNWTPALQSAVATVDSTAALLAPVDAPIFTAATIGFNAASNLLAGQARAYLADPSASALALIQTQVAVFQQQVNTALLQAAKIVDQASQAHALAAVQAVATIVETLVGLVQSVSSKAAVAHMAALTTVKLAEIEPYLNNVQTAQAVADHYHEPIALARLQVARAFQAETRAGF